jgi:hypothetical protein
MITTVPIPPPTAIFPPLIRRRSSTLLLVLLPFHRITLGFVFLVKLTYFDKYSLLLPLILPDDDPYDWIPAESAYGHVLSLHIFFL